MMNLDFYNLVGYTLLFYLVELERQNIIVK